MIDQAAIYCRHASLHLSPDEVGQWSVSLSCVEPSKFVSVRLCLRSPSVKPRTYYPHVTWAHVMLRVLLGYLTSNSGADSHFCQLCLSHVIWSGALVGSRASTLLKFLLSHTFRETWRTRRVLFNTVNSCFQKWRKCLLKKCANGPFIWHQVTRL
jgi:hypothetical protein